MRFRSSSTPLKWLLPLGMLVLTNIGSADETFRDYLRGLRDRRMFSVAEGICLDELADSPTPERAALLTEQLAITFADHARYVTPEEQADLWRRAVGRLTDYLTKYPDRPERVRLELAHAHVDRIRAEFSFWNAVTSPEDDRLLSEATSILATVSDRYRVLIEEIETTRRLIVRRGRATSKTLPAGELRRLELRGEQELVSTLLMRATLATSPARRDPLLDEAEELASSIERQATETRDRWGALADAVTIARLRGNSERAFRMIGELNALPIPKPIRTRLLAETVRLLLDEGDALEADDLLSKERLAEQGLRGELFLLRTRTLLTRWEFLLQRDQKALAEVAWKQVQTHVENTERETGGYWAYRSRTLFARAAETEAYGLEVAGLLRQAREAYADGQRSEAVTLFDRAAERTADAKVRAELEFTAASVLLQGRSFAEAAKRLLTYVEEYDDSERVPQAHLLACWCLGQLYSGDRTDENLKRYQSELKLHRQRYTDPVTVGEATWMFGRLQETRLQRSRAIEVYRSIPLDHTRGAAARVAIARSYEGILEYLTGLDQPTGYWRNRAIEELGRMASELGAGQQPLTLPEAEVRMRLARVQIQYPPTNWSTAALELADLSADYARVKSEKGFDAAAAANTWEPLMRLAMQLRILALAGRGDVVAAEKLLDDLAGENVTQLLQVLDGLVQTAERVDERTRSLVASLQLRTAEALDRRRDELSEAERKRLDRSLANALVTTNQPRRAVEQFEKMLDANPKDAATIRKVALSLIECGDADCLKKAQTHWKRLENGTKPGTERWFEARYYRIYCAANTQQTAEAGKLLRVTKVLYPTLGGTDWKPKFESLEKTLSS